MSPSFCCLVRSPEERVGDEAAFVFDTPSLAGDEPQVAAIVLPEGPEARADTLLAAGAVRVMVGEAALLDSGVVERLVAKYGGERVGLYVPVQKMAVDWSFETASNADFKVVTPSLCEPAWEILRANGSGSGTHAAWWIGEMVQRGVQMVLMRADIRDDDDLNLCAGMVEMLGKRLWLAPLADDEPPLADWITYGQARQMALPPALYQRREDFMLPSDDAAPAVRIGDMA